MKLYYVPRTRSNRPRWLLEELGVPYDLVRMERADTKKPEYLKKHPLGHVPAFDDDDGTTIFESAAICAYLADKFIDKKLAPPFGSTERALWYQWLIFSMATLEPPVAQVAYHTRLLPEEKRIPAIAEEGARRFGDVARTVADALGDREYMLGSFSAIDILIGSTIIWAKSTKLLEGRGLPSLEAYADRLKARPAYQRASAD